MKIDKLEIKNFKFFDEVEALDFNSKNILIYGENGSGKSTIYWALYTLLQSSKKDVNRIKKYFIHSTETSPNNSSLVNIYANEENAKIEIFSNESDDKFIISKNDITIQESTIIEKSLYTSDFINYKYLFRFFNFLHQEEIDLFTLFEYEVLHLLQLNEQWQEIIKLEKDKPRIKAEKTEYNALQKEINEFNEALSTKVLDLNNPTKDYLEKFGYSNIKVTLSFIFGKYKKQIFDRPQIKIKIDVLKDGEEKHITRPQSYFNEAKLTAIALSVRLAITEIKLQDSPLKLLVLDDLLVSLDMSNRDKVLDILLDDNILNGYQKIILTHDRAFFEMAKHKFDYRESGEWKYFEMYLDDKGDFEKPFILPHRNYFQKAEFYFIKKDYSACANYLRKEAERLLKKLLCNDVECTKFNNLQELINQAKVSNSSNSNIIDKVNELIQSDNFQNFIDFDKNKLTSINDKKIFGIVRKYLKDLEEYSTNNSSENLEKTLDSLTQFKNIIFNPQSHDNTSIPLYKKELEDAIEVIKELRESV